MQQGHDNEIAALYAENRVALLRRAYKYMNDWDAASDVVQTSMLKFIRMFGKLSRLRHIRSYKQRISLVINNKFPGFVYNFHIHSLVLSAGLWYYIP